MGRGDRPGVFHPIERPCLWRGSGQTGRDICGRVVMYKARQRAGLILHFFPLAAFERQRPAVGHRLCHLFSTLPLLQLFNDTCRAGRGSSRFHLRHPPSVTTSCDTSLRIRGNHPPCTNLATSLHRVTRTIATQPCLSRRRTSAPRKRHEPSS